MNIWGNTVLLDGKMGKFFLYFQLPTSRDVITHLANVFTALCLNDKGLKQFTAYEPFDQFFKIIISIKFLTTMKKRRSEMSKISEQNLKSWIKLFFSSGWKNEYRSLKKWNFCVQMNEWKILIWKIAKILSEVFLW